MSLQFILGNSGAGKTRFACQHIIEASLQHPKTSFYVIVPEQFTMQTQKNLVELHPGKGILNIDILSFERLAYRVFEEVGGDNRKLLEDTGKSMVIRKLVQQHEKELPYLGSQMKKPGYIDEVKSLISEFMQYDVGEEELQSLIEADQQKLLQMKLQDVKTLYHNFMEYLEGRYLTGEEVLDILLKVLPLSEKLKGSVLLFDGFTGFTPIQIKVLQELLAMAQKVYVTVTIDGKEDPFAKGKAHQLFYMSRKMIQSVSALTKEIEEPLYLGPGENSRFQNAPALNFLEQHLFRYHRSVYEEEPQEIRIFQAAGPKKELEEVTRRIARLVREKDYRYGEIAIITGNLEEYAPFARQVLEEAQIPFFVDEKHSVLMNPFVEYLRAAMEMVTDNYSYETVFRYLRCGMSDISREETDLLENYVRALGIRGLSRWSEKWVRVYPGMDPGTIQELNGIRKRFTEETQMLAQGFRGGKKTIREYCLCLYHFICPEESSGRKSIQQKLYEKEQIFASLGDKAMEKEYAQIYGIIMDLLDKMVEILGDESVTAREFEELLETGMAEAKVALIPPSMDQILVGDMERTRLKDIRALFFVGVNEGNIPKSAQAGGILSEMDREFLSGQGMELAPGPKEQMNMQRFYLYLNLCKPGELLCLSCSRSNSRGEAIMPAYLINQVRSLFPKLELESAESMQEPVRHLQTPGTAMEYFLNGLLEEHAGEKDPVFQELYSWYLKSPEYGTTVRGLVDAAFTRKPADVISKSVAKVLYGEVSPYSATRLERFSACAFAHFLQYGLKVTERAEYEFRAMDMGNLMHQALEDFALEVHKQGLQWKDLEKEEREALADQCLDQAAADYGNTILKSSARNEAMLERTRRLLYRTVWALQQQLKNGAFTPEGFEVSFGGGRIDRLDILEEDEKVYIKVIDYKTGNTSFDLLALYHGLQLQLMIYLDAALEIEGKRFPDKSIEPAGVFYYNIKDPMLQEQMASDLGDLDERILKELKMNGLVQADPEIVRKLDQSLVSLPVAVNRDGSFRKGSGAATREQFAILDRYVRKKISNIQEAILEGNAEVAPYELKKKDACTYCPYFSVCGYDRKIPGFEHRRLKSFRDEELWQAFLEGGEDHGSDMD